MEVYLQPFYTKCLIDEATQRLHQVQRRGKSLERSDRMYFHVRYGMLAVTGVVQSVSFLAIWAFSSLATLFTVGLIKPLDTLSDESGSLCVAALIGAGIAACSAVKITSAGRLSARLASHVDKQFRDRLAHFESQSVRQASRERQRRKKQASGRENGPYPEAYFDPGVYQMRSERKALIQQLKKKYPSDVNGKFGAYSQAKRALRRLEEKQTQKLADLPVSRKEIDSYLVYKSACLADEAIRDINQYTLKVWSERIHNWGHKFDRESFSRRCLKILKEQKVSKRVKRLVQDVKDAEQKGYAFNDFESDLKGLVRQIKNKVAAVGRPWPWIRAWRHTYPWICSWRIAQAADQLIDPDIVR